MPDPIPPKPASGPPFITRRSLLGFSAIATAAFVAYGQLYDASNSGAGRLGMAAAGAFGIALVVGLIAWIGGIRLAGRSGSMLWLFVVALTPPFGSLAYSLWGPAAAPSGPGPGGTPPRPGMRR
jgi:hypothetical protein